jgi:hypothetical protein
MQRREFIAGLGSAAAWPVVARAQQAALPVKRYLAPFAQGFAETGYVLGRLLSLSRAIRTGRQRSPLISFAAISR